MKKPEYVPYGEEWRKYMARLKKADVIRIASKALMQKESERQEMIDALMKAVEWDSHDDTGYPAVWFEQAKQALRNAGMEDL